MGISNMWTQTYDSLCINMQRRVSRNRRPANWYKQTDLKPDLWCADMAAALLHTHYVEMYLWQHLDCVWCLYKYQKPNMSKLADWVLFLFKLIDWMFFFWILTLLLFMARWLNNYTYIHSLIWALWNRNDAGYSFTSKLLISKMMFAWSIQANTLSSHSTLALIWLIKSWTCSTAESSCSSSPAC